MDQTGGQSPISQPNTVQPDSAADGSITIPHGDQSFSVSVSSSSITPTTFDMVTPQQALSQNQQASPQVTASQPIAQASFVTPQTQAVASEPLQQPMSSVLQLNTETPPSSPVQSDMSGFIPTPQPSITEDVAQDTRPDWQRQIYTDISNNQVPMAQPSMPNDVQASGMNQLTQISPYNNPVDIPVSPAPPIFTQPEEPFSLSYDVNTGEPVSGSGSTLTRKLLLGGILITLICAIGGSIYAAYTFGNNAGYKKGQAAESARLQAQAEQQANNNNQTDTTSDAELSFDLIEPTYKDEVVTGIVGEQLVSSDGFVLLVNDIERDFFVQGTLKEGYEFIKVNFLLGNASSTAAMKIANGNFKLKNAVGALIDYDQTATDYEGMVDTLNLSPGSKAQMSVVFQVEAGSDSLQFIREQAYTSKATNQLVTSSIEVALDS